MYSHAPGGGYWIDQRGVTQAPERRTSPSCLVNGGGCGVHWARVPVDATAASRTGRARPGSESCACPRSDDQARAVSAPPGSRWPCGRPGGQHVRPPRRPRARRALRPGHDRRARPSLARCDSTGGASGVTHPRAPPARRQGSRRALPGPSARARTRRRARRRLARPDARGAERPRLLPGSGSPAGATYRTAHQRRSCRASGGIRADFAMPGGAR